jgi:hypothetical protein
MNMAFIVGDLAQRRGSDTQTIEALRPDYTVVFYSEIWEGVCYVKECLFGRWNDPETGKNISQWNYDRHRNSPVFLEGLNALSVAEHMRVNVRAVKLEIREIPIDHTPDAKNLRQKRLHDEMQKSRILLHPDLQRFNPDAFRLLDAQLKAFPEQVQGHDDFRDALSLVAVVMQEFLSSGAAPNGTRPTSGRYLDGNVAQRMRLEREEREQNANDEPYPPLGQ